MAIKGYSACWEQYWTSPGVNTPQDTNYTATCLPSRKLYKLDEPDTQDTAGEARTSWSVMYSYGHPHMAKQKQDDQLEHTYSSSVRIRDVTLKTSQKWWMKGRSGERGSGISVLAARHDDDDDDDDFLFAKPCRLELYNPLTASLERRKSQLMNVLDLALKHLMMWLKHLSSGEYRVPLHCNYSQVHSDPE